MHEASGRIGEEYEKSRSVSRGFLVKENTKNSDFSDFSNIALPLAERLFRNLVLKNKKLKTSLL
jgi:hypothetical protein